MAIKHMEITKINNMKQNRNKKNLTEVSEVPDQNFGENQVRQLNNFLLNFVN